MQIQGLAQKVALAALLGVLVMFALALFANVNSLVSTLSRFQWTLLPLIAGLTLVNYALRFVKWHFYLGQIDIRIELLDSFAIFSSGLCMAITPGKIGEVLKPVLLKIRTGVAVSRTAPVVMAERLTDGIAMIILAGVGLLVSRQGWHVLVPTAVLAVVVLAALGNGWGADLVLRICTRVPYVDERLSHVENFLGSSRALFTLKNLVLAICLGVISWSAEGVAFYVVLLGLKVAPSFTTLIQATFVLATSTLVGSVSMLPGGLGAADASVAGLLIVVLRLARVKAAAATVIIRFATLWFGVAVGLVALMAFHGRFRDLSSDGNPKDGLITPSAGARVDTRVDIRPE